MIYHFACSKGGVGKTTMACNFAAYLTLPGVATTIDRSGTVCLVDGDKQLHSTAWALRRARSKANGFPELQNVRATTILQKGRTGAVVRDVTTESFHVVVDTAGYDSAEMRSVLTVADVVIIPLAVSEVDLQACEAMNELLQQARGFNPGLKAIAFINKAPNNWVRRSDIDDAMAFVREFDGFQLAETIVHLRDAFSIAWGEGKSVHEFGPRGEKAADEFGRLCVEIDAMVNG